MIRAQDLDFAPQRRDFVGGSVGIDLGNNMMLLLAQHDPDTGA